jgi:hypothetical protein
VGAALLILLVVVAAIAWALSAPSFYPVGERPP